VVFAGVCRTWEVVMDRWTVTVEEAAQMLGISRSSAHECVRRGELRALRLGRRRVVAHRWGCSSRILRLFAVRL